MYKKNVYGSKHIIGVSLMSCHVVDRQHGNIFKEFIVQTAKLFQQLSYKIFVSLGNYDIISVYCQHL